MCSRKKISTLNYLLQTNYMINNLLPIVYKPNLLSLTVLALSIRWIYLGLWVMHDRFVSARQCL